MIKPPDTFVLIYLLYLITLRVKIIKRLKIIKGSSVRGHDHLDGEGLRIALREIDPLAAPVLPKSDSGRFKRIGLIVRYSPHMPRKMTALLTGFEYAIYCI